MNLQLASSLFLLLLFSSTMAWEWPKDSSSVVDYCYPDQVHISLGDAYYNSWNNFSSVKEEISNSSVIIVWQTQSLCDNFYVMIQDESETLKLNITADKIWNELQNATIGKGRNQLVYDTNGQYTSYSHTVMIPNLESGVHYTYQIFQTNGSNSAGPFTFMLPEMSPKDTSQPTKFAVYANVDTVLNNITLDSFKLLKRENPDDISFHLFLGDIGYFIESENGKRGEYFYNSWQSVLATTPFMVTPGVRDRSGNSSFFNFRTRMPLYNQTNNHYYSFNVDKMHILAVNHYFYLYSSTEIQQRMFEWIEADLKAANASRSERPWIVIATHNAVYCSLNDNNTRPEKRCYNFYERLARFDELYFKYRVDLVLQGREQYWERMGPIYKNSSLNFSSWSESQRKSHMINPEGPIYTIEGAAGNAYYMEGLDYVEDEWIVRNLSMPLANYSINVDSHFSFSTLTIVNGSALKYEHINSKNGDVIDYFYLLKGDEYMLKSDEYRVVRPFERSGFFAVLAALFGLVMIAGIYLSRRLKVTKVRKIGLLLDQGLWSCSDCKIDIHKNN